MKQIKEHMKDMNMKHLFRRNQVIITTPAVMIVAVGYLNYSGKKDLASDNRVYGVGAMGIPDEDILAENQTASLSGQAGLQGIPSPNQDPPDLDAVSDANGAQAAADTGVDQGQLVQAGDGTGAEEATQVADPGQMTAADTDSPARAGLKNPGEAVLIGGMNIAGCTANVQLSREQARVRNKEILMSLISSDSIGKTAKQKAIQDMINPAEVPEREDATEILLMARGLSDSVASITKSRVDVVVNVPSTMDPQRTQIEDVVRCKVEMGADRIIITLLNMAEQAGYIKKARLPL